MSAATHTVGGWSPRRTIARLRSGQFDMADVLITVPAVLCCGVILLLLCYVVWLSFIEPNGGLFNGEFTLDNYRRLFADGIVQRAAINTFIFCLVSVVVAALIGVPMAWLVERTDIPGKSLIWALAIIGVLIPGFFTAMGWIFMLHDRIGMIQGIARSFGFDVPLSIVNIWGMGWVQGLSQAPLFFLMTASSFSAMDPRLEEAAYMSGASIGQVLRRIIAPLIAPGVLAASIYSFSLAIGAFDVPGTIGLSNRILTFSTLLYFKLYPPFGSPDYGIPAAFGSLMLVFAVLVSMLYMRVLRAGRKYETISGKGYSPRRIKLGRWTGVAWGFIGLYVFLSLVGPLLLLVWSSLLPYFVPPTTSALSLVSLQNFRDVPWGQVMRGLTNTLILMAVVPTAVVGASVTISWVILRSRIPGRFLFDAVAFLPHALPSILFSLSAALIALALARIVPLYGSIMLVAIVYTVWWISFGTRVVNSALIHIHSELEEAASVAGASRFSILGRVLLPILKPALTGAWLWVALLCFRELTMAVLLFSPRNVTLPVISWTLWQGGKFGHASVVTLIIVLASAPLIYVYFRLLRRDDVGPGH